MASLVMIARVRRLNVVFLPVEKCIFFALVLSVDLCLLVYQRLLILYRAGAGGGSTFVSEKIKRGQHGVYT